MSFLKVIWGVLFDEGSTRGKETNLEAFTEVRERFVIMSQRFICGPDIEDLSKNEEDSDCQRPWRSALENDTSLSIQSAGES